MDEELKTYLDGKFAEVGVKFAEVNTKFEVVNAKFADVDRKFAEVDRKFAEAREEMHDMEKRLLSEFWKWGRTTEIRVRRLEGQDATTAERLAAMEERIFTLERKVAGSKE